MVALYIILGFIAYFNFGFHSLMIEKIGGKSTQSSPSWKNLEKNIRDTQMEISIELEHTFSDQEVSKEEK